MGHKGIRESGPPRRPGFRPEDVVGTTVHRALVELAHEGYDAHIAKEHATPTFALWLSNRVHLRVADGIVREVIVG